MNYFQHLRVIWARRWLVFWSFLIVSALGITASLMMLPQRYTAEVTLVFDSKTDPTSAQGWQPGPDMSTQLEILRSERVAERAVKLLELEKDPEAQALWQRATEGKTKFEAFHAMLLNRSMTAEPARASSLILISMQADTAAMAAKAANAMAQAYLDVSVELRVAPARQYAVWFEQQSAVLRADLERAQSRLSKFQQERRIVGQDDRVDEEISKLNMLTAQLSAAQAERAEAAGRLASSGSDTSVDVQSSPVVAGLKSELARAEARLSEISNIVGTNHPQRIGLESQIAELRRQIAAESRRVSGGTASATRAQAAKVNELQSMVDQQRARVLSMRGSRDELNVLLKDVENAQRAYESARTRMSELSLQSANQQASARVLSPAVEPLAPKSKVPAGIAGSILAGIIVGFALAVFFEALDPRVRGIEDLAGVDGVPVIGVLQTGDAKVPSYRRFALGAPYERKLLPLNGSTGGTAGAQT
jgi:chain length determinant protein EpsF